MKTLEELANMSLDRLETLHRRAKTTKAKNFIKAAMKAAMMQNLLLGIIAELRKEGKK